VINNSSNPFVPNPSTKKKPTGYAGSGAGGRVQDASLFTFSRGASAVNADIFSSTKIVQRELVPCAVRASPAPSLVVNANGNFDGQKVGLNQGYQAPCTLFQPQGNTQLVVRNPALDRLGVTSRDTWNGARGTNYGVQNPIDCSMTTANHEIKLIHHGNLNSRPARADFRTSITGPQTSQDGSLGRPGKLGGALARPRYVESHHGNPNINHPSKFSSQVNDVNKPESYPIPRNA
jgi:hypothetical protein